jgi:hypothetical protein
MRRGDTHVVTIGRHGWSCMCGHGKDGLSARAARIEGDHHADDFGGTIKEER